MSKQDVLSGLFSKRFFATTALCLLIGIAVTRIHLRVEYTLTGYNLGNLKNKEQELLEERSILRMQLAKLTTKKHLEVMAKVEDRLNKPQTLAHNL